MRCHSKLSRSGDLIANMWLEVLQIEIMRVEMKAQIILIGQI